MVFVPPVNKKVKHSGRKKRLNIYNTDKFYNLQVTKTSEVKNYKSINILTKGDIDLVMTEQSPMQLAMSEDKYLYVQGALLSDEYVLTMIKKGMQVFYYAKGLVPDKILDALAESSRGGIIYQMHREFPRELVNNVIKAHECTVVIIDCPIVIPDISPVSVLTVLAPLATNVDEVQVDVMPLHDNEIHEFGKPYYYVSLKDSLWHCFPKHKFAYFKELKTPLSGWGMAINLLADDDAEYQALEELKAKDKG